MKIIKYIIVFYTALSTVVMAQENQVLYCSDIDANGFIANENGIKFDGYNKNILYRRDDGFIITYNSNCR